MPGVHKGQIPLFYWLLPFLIGIVIGLHTAADRWGVCITSILLLCVTLFVVLELLYETARLYRKPWVGGVLLHLMLMSGGWWCMQLHDQLNKSDHFFKQRSAYLIVKIADEPRQKGIYTRFVAQVQATVQHKRQRPASGKLLVTLVADSNAHLVSYGDLLLIPSVYKTVDPPFNPGEFNYKQYLAHQNIYHQAFITRPGFRLLQHDIGNPLIAFALRLRQQLVISIKKHIADEQAAAIASTLLLGYKADLSANVLQAYSKTGTIHVLSVSGAHVAIFFVLISFLLRPFKHYRYGKVLNAVLSATLIWAYALLTGLSPAVCRAALMLSMLIIGRASSRPVHALNMLGFSAWVLLLYDPLLITDVGFQLSYLAVFGLVAVHPIIYEQYEFKNKWLQKLWYLSSASLAAQLITFPLTIWYFHQFPVYFLISNLLIILPAEAIVMVGLTFLISSTIPALHTITGWLGYLLEHLILIMNAVLSYIEHLPLASWSRLWLNGIEHMLLYGIVISTICYLAYKRPYQILTAAACVLILCYSLSLKAINLQQRDHMVFLNLKKHTGIIFRTGNKAVIVTDLTAADRNFSYSIKPCLDSLGVDSQAVVSLNKDLTTSYFSKRGPLIQFKNKMVLLFEPLLQNTVLSPKLHIDHLLFTHNPHANISFLQKNYHFDHIIADAGNSAERLMRLQHEADSLNIKINLLRSNKALVVVSKQ